MEGITHGNHTTTVGDIGKLCGEERGGEERGERGGEGRGGEGRGGGGEGRGREGRGGEGKGGEVWLVNMVIILYKPH